MNVGMYLAFLKWCFMKMFGGCFNKAELFREELKKGAPDSIFAFFAFLILSFITLAAILLTSVALFDDKAIIGMIALTSFWTVIFTFVYNVVKAAFECFLEEREQVFEELKR
jgi:hypothetical protein